MHPHGIKKPQLVLLLIYNWTQSWLSYRRSPRRQTSRQSGSHPTTYHIPDLIAARRLRARLDGADPLAGRVALRRIDFVRAGLGSLRYAR